MVAFQLAARDEPSSSRLHCQFHCFEDGRKGMVLGAEAWMSQDARTLIRVEAQRVASANNICFRALLPNPAEQQFRVLLPICEPDSVSSKYEWRLECHCTTLGQLILALGERYTASQIYFFYRTLRIIAVKRRKDHTSDNRARRVGSHASELKPAQIKQSHRTDRTEIVRQYLAITGQVIELPEPDTESFRVLFDAALRNVYAYVLQDMSPPWLSTFFGSGISGLGVYTRPAFLQWSAEAAPHIFGPETATVFRRLCSRAGLAWAGIVARPLYVCTAAVSSDGASSSNSTNICMNCAAMSPLLETPSACAHKAWLCKSCREVKREHPVIPQRCLRMYALVQVGDGDSTPLRSRKLTALVSPPPRAFAWPRKPVAFDPPDEEVSPVITNNAKSGLTFAYSSGASEGIWLSARAFQPVEALERQMI